MDVSRSGRARKKSAKLLEMEETEVEFSSVGKAKRKSDSDTALKKSPKAGSPKKKGSMSALFPRVASVIGDVTAETSVVPTSLTFAETSVVPTNLTLAFQAAATSHDVEAGSLEIAMKTPKSSKTKKRPSGDVMQVAASDVMLVAAGDSGVYDIQGQVEPPKAKKRKTSEKKSPKKVAEATPATHTAHFVPAVPQPSEQQDVLGYSFDDEEIHEEYDEDYDEGTGEDDVVEVKDDEPYTNYDVNDEDDINISSDDVIDEETETEDELPEVEKNMAVSPATQMSPLSSPPSGSKKKTKASPKKNQPKAKKPTKPKGKEKAKPKESKGKRGKPRTTGYTLWCNQMRRQVMLQHPELDFAQVSKKLSELWNTVSASDKQGLRRRAKTIQRRQDRGEDVQMKPRAMSTHLRSGQSVVRGRAKTQARQLSIHYTSVNYTYKVTENNPIDVAAHLKLLGESLATIGARLQEHKGQIAVQGSLSVLLDSLLCALGPLLCLTNQVPELDCIAMETHKQTLDNLAYIMPGIG